MAEAFTDLRLVGLDDRLTYNPKPERTGLFALHFTLSGSAPEDWVTIANVRHLGSTWVTCGRRVRATNSHLIAECALAEAQQMVDVLKPIVEKVNEEYRQHAAEQARLADQKATRDRELAARRKETANTLKFD